MKKTLFALAALAMLAACNKAEVISVDRQAIAFGDAFVDNATKAIDPSFGDNKLVDEFNVWGTVTGNTGNTLNLYNGARVYDTTPTYGVAYDCEQTEYWIPSATYNFVAIANATGVVPATGIPATIKYTVDGTSDLLYAEPVVVKTDASAAPTSGVNVNNCVAFNFKHLLSKVLFTFTNASDAKCTYKITNIAISGLTEKGTYTISNSSWDNDGTGTKSLSFGNATNATSENATDAQSITNANPVTSHFERLILPGTQSITVSFHQEFWFDADGDGAGTPIKMNESDFSKTFEHTFAANGAYNIAVELKSGTEITFTVNSMTGWDEETSITIP
jgi:hypothetical protein